MDAVRKIPRAKKDHFSGFENGTEKAEGGLGGLHRVEKGMQAPLMTPCAECPMRSDSNPGYLGGYTPEMYLQAIYSNASLACHCSPGFHAGKIETQRHCTGMAAVRANWGVDVLMHPNNSARDAVDAVREGFGPGLEKVFFKTPEDFFNHHKKGQKDG